ncbi:hypothetical protein [Variibacter gotjawalensis]|uniref:hypothetical protein n=1 Tax=Variibacter gotjawalensis TaxID=1333996 RepID=UPI00102D12EA|nr:hypothetical protein [Variibacter gotjawalensis]NIK47846.1 hypothetical protein [Variibacter gotjawalensis]
MKQQLRSKKPVREKRLAGRPRINSEQTPARFPAGTLASIDACLAPGERLADFLREAVSRELKRRARTQNATNNIEHPAPTAPIGNQNFTIDMLKPAKPKN